MVVHTLAYNWDYEQADFGDFAALSGWTSLPQWDPAQWACTTWGGQTWWYLKDAEFYGEAGQLHPTVDWARCMEAYFYGGDPDDLPGTPDSDPSWMAEHMPTKFAFVDDFVTNFHG